MNRSELINNLKQFDWKHEWSSNDTYRQKQIKRLEQLEAAVFEMWKQEPTEAVKIWNSCTPCQTGSDEQVPSFIMRRQLLEAV